VVYTLIDHPMNPLPSHPILKRLVKADIHSRLAERSASAWDVLHLHAELLDHLHYPWHHVASIHVEDQDGDNVIRSRRDVRCQHLVHPRDHHLPSRHFPGTCKSGSWGVATLKMDNFPVSNTKSQSADRDNVIRSRRHIRCQHLVHPRDHHLLVHPGIFLALVKVGLGVLEH